MSNHTEPGQTPPWPMIARMALTPEQAQKCKKQEEDADEKCKDAKLKQQKYSIKYKGAVKEVTAERLDCSEAPGCEEARACVLKPKKDDKKFCCSPNNTGHHLVEVHCFSIAGDRGTALKGFEKYNERDAPCTCASTSRHTGTHGVLHKIQGKLEKAYMDRGDLKGTWEKAGEPIGTGGKSYWNYGEARGAGLAAHHATYPHCDPVCTANQLNDYHNKCDINDKTPLRSDPGAKRKSKVALDSEQEGIMKAAVDAARNVTKVGF